MAPPKKSGHNNGPTFTAEELMQMQDTYGAKHYRRDKFLLVKSDGMSVWDSEGREYLDFNAQYSAQPFGGNNHELVQTMTEQACKFTGSQNSFYNEWQPRLVKRLEELTGHPLSLITNSGAEAVETAVKAACRWAYEVKRVPDGEAEIIAAEDNFHGRTISAISLSATAKYKKHFAPFPKGRVIVPFNDIEAFEKAITPNTAAFIVEPIQGEGGINIPSDDYFKKVRELCDKHRVLLIFDEVQTGLGRTGKLFAMEHFGVRPDATLLGKALGQIIPVSAVCGSEELLGVFDPGSHGSTFAGTALPCAVAMKSLEQITRHNQLLVKNTEYVGTYFLSELRKAGFKEARGKGLLIGIPLDPKKMTAEDARLRLIQERIIAGAASNNVVRFSPPLIATKADVDFAIPRIVRALT
jgi:ornithine--oxo-acid transaminase